MLYFILTAMICLFTLGGQQSKPKTEADDLKQLQGHWKPVDIESKEKPQQPELISKQDVIRHLRVTFEGNDFITIFGDEVQKQTIQLNQVTQPKSIDFTRDVMQPPQVVRIGEKPKPFPPPKKETVKGIYELTENKLKICLAHNAKDERPRSFEAALQSGLDIMVFVKDTDKRAASKLSDTQLLGELRKLGVDAFSSGDRRDTGSIYVTIRGEDADQKLKDIASTLRKVSHVTGLHLHDCSVTDAGLAYLKDVNNLGHINLSGTKITDAGLVHLSGMTNLHLVILNDTGVTAEGIAKLKKSLPQLEVEKLSKERLDAEKAIQKAGGILFTEKGTVKGIEFSLHNNLSDKELKQLEGALELSKETLTRLSLAGTSITDAGLKSLYPLKQRKRLDLRDTKATKEGAAELKREIPGLQVVLSE